MAHRRAVLLMLVVSQATTPGALAAGQNNWLMMVATENTDPSQASQFNDWYDNIDIPDVLKVPGYQRARRGVEQRIAEPSTGDSQQKPLQYIALYDIKSQAIDKTIIDMLMASWGMEKSHHSTDLLKVTGRAYFQQFGPAYSAPLAKSSKPNKYLYMMRFDCCGGLIATREFDGWYDHKYVPAILASPGFTRITRYRLYRVLMDHPVTIPEFLSVLELEADSATQAVRDLEEVQHRFPDADRQRLSMVGGSRLLFLQIKDVARQ